MSSPKSSRPRYPGRAIGTSLIAGLIFFAGLVTADEIQLLPLGGRIAKTRSRISQLQLGDVSSTAKRNWGPEQVEGPPDVAAAGTSPQAWASLSADGQIEWLLCEYEAPVEVRAVIVHESALPGGLIKVSAFNSDDDEIIAWEGDDPTPRGAPRGVSVIPVKLAFPVGRIRITIDSPATTGWNEIDAVGLEDASGKIHWAKHVTASSTYAMPQNAPATKSRLAYSPIQATGPPNATGPGDRATAWCPATEGGQPEWLELRYKTAQQVTEIVVHENLSPGGVTKIGVFDANGKETTAWEGVDPTPRNEPWGVSVFPVNVNFRIQRLKLYLDSQDSVGYHEIDAVGLCDDEGQTQWAAQAEASSSWGAQQNSLINARVMPAADKNVRELQQELKALRTQMEDLKKQLQELKEGQRPSTKENKTE